MNIGFDAKRAFHNSTGLGHYSRTLIRSLSEFFPEHQYYLFNPKKADLFEITGSNIHEVLPEQFLHKLVSAAWRTSWVRSDLQKYAIDLYHGLSNEIPMKLSSTGIKSVVTIHDLIFERHPEQYSRIDTEIYRRKYKYACQQADRIIAISEQTKKDLIDIYAVAAEKIDVCYQSCNPAFAVQVGAEEKKKIRDKYDLPEKYFLYVGSVISRKNLLSICKAIFLMRNDFNIPLVVIGNGGSYKQKVKDYLKQSGMENRVIFLSENALANVSSSFLRAEDFPAIYQMAVAMIYPSFFEGFGIPVLEALFSRLPVITSNVSCLPEAGGDGACYVDPNSAGEIGEWMKKILTDPSFAGELTSKGWQHALNFTQEKCAGKVMEVYKKLMK